MLNYQTEKFQYWQQKIKTLSCAYNNYTVSQRTPQTLIRPHPGPRRRCAYRIEPRKLSWRRIIKQSCKVSFRGAIAGFADDHDDDEQRLSNNDWYVYNFHSQFIFGCVFHEKRDSSQHSGLRLVRTSWTRSLALAPHRPQPAWPMRGRVRGWRVDLR